MAMLLLLPAVVVDRLRSGGGGVGGQATAAVEGGRLCPPSTALAESKRGDAGARLDPKAAAGMAVSLFSEALRTEAVKAPVVPSLRSERNVALL